MSFNKEGIGYKPFKKKKAYKNLCVQVTCKNKSHTLCNYCLQKVHISYPSPLTKSNTNIIQVWIPKGTRLQNMVITNIGSKFDVKVGKF